MTMINYKHKGNNQQRFLYEKREHPLSLKQRIPCRQTSRHKKSLIANNIKNKIKMKEKDDVMPKTKKRTIMTTKLRTSIFTIYTIQNIFNIIIALLVKSNT